MTYEEMQQQRRTNLAAVVRPERRGAIAQFARENNLDATLISQLLNGHRAFTEPQARDLEVMAKLPAGSLDATPGAPPGSIEEIEQVFRRSSAINDEDKNYLLGLIKTMAKRWQSNKPEDGEK